MLLKFKNFTIRNATVNDAPLLERWWNDGIVMAHAGFPNGTGETAEQISESLKQDTENKKRFMIELNEIPIGEMSYSVEGEGTACIGIKICDFSKQVSLLTKFMMELSSFTINFDFPSTNHLVPCY